MRLKIERKKLAKSGYISVVGVLLLAVAFMGWKMITDKKKADDALEYQAVMAAFNTQHPNSTPSTQPSKVTAYYTMEWTDKGGMQHYSALIGGVWIDLIEPQPAPTTPTTPSN